LPQPVATGHAPNTRQSCPVWVGDRCRYPCRRPSCPTVATLQHQTRRRCGGATPCRRRRAPPWSDASAVKGASHTAAWPLPNPPCPAFRPPSGSSAVPAPWRYICPASTAAPTPRSGSILSDRRRQIGKARRPGRSPESDEPSNPRLIRLARAGSPPESGSVHHSDAGSARRSFAFTAHHPGGRRLRRDRYLATPWTTRSWSPGSVSTRRSWPSPTEPGTVSASRSD